jgi:gliding motility-associated-like protein
MIKRLYILFLILTSIVSSIRVDAQYLDNVCVGMTRVYRVAAPVGATLNWKVEGGSVHNNWNDSIEVKWDKTGVYNIEVEQISSSNCRSYTSGQIKVGEQPKLSPLDKTTYLCRGKYIELDAGSEFAYYYWNNKEGNQKLLIDQGGKYKVTAYTPEGCSASDSVEINEVENPKVNLGSDLYLCGAETLELDGGEDGPYYSWSDKNSSSRYNTVHSVLSPEILKVKVTNAYGCSASDSIILYPCDYSKFVQSIPNTFTPSDDPTSKNNTWFIPWLYQFPTSRIDIYDRWGQTVYTSKNGLPAEGWDGKFKGKFLPTDSYYYIIDLRTGAAPIRGTVTIVR